MLCAFCLKKQMIVQCFSKFFQKGLNNSNLYSLSIYCGTNFDLKTFYEKKRLLCIISLNIENNGTTLESYLHYPHFTDEKLRKKT